MFIDVEDLARRPHSPDADGCLVENELGQAQDSSIRLRSEMSWTKAMAYRRPSIPEGCCEPRREIQRHPSGDVAVQDLASLEPSVSANSTRPGFTGDQGVDISHGQRLQFLPGVAKKRSGFLVHFSDPAFPIDAIDARY